MSPLLRLNEAYFQRLLRQSDAIDAVATLCGFWQPRVAAEEAQFGLTKPEWQVHLVVNYSGEISNGGHSQYILNRGTKHMAATLSALNDVGVVGCEDAVQTMLMIAERTNFLTVHSPQGLEELHKRDIEIWPKLSNVDELLQDFLRRNSAEVLIPERGSRK
jgi:hypothetical protein